MKQKLLYLLLCVMALANTHQARADWNQYDLSSRVKLTSKLSNKDQYFTIEYPEENYVGLYNDGIYNVRISTPDGVVFSKPNPNNSSMTTDGYGYHCLTSTKEVEENSTSAGKDARYRTVDICMKPVIKLSEYQNLTVTIDFDLYIDKTGDNATPKTQYHYSKTFTAKELIAEGMLCPSIQKKAFTYSQDKLTVECTLSSLPEELTWFTGLMYSDPANHIKDNIVTSKSFDISLGNDEYNTNRTFTVTPLAFRDCNCGGYWFTRYFVSDNSETLTIGRRRLSNLRLTNNANSIQLDWDITAGGTPGGLVIIKRRSLGEEDFKVVRTLPDDVTTYYDSSVNPNTFTGYYSITYQGAYDSTPDEKIENEAFILNTPYWLLSDSVATLCYKKYDKKVLGFIHEDRSAWADKANRVVIDPSVASCPLESANGLFRSLSKVRSIEGMQHLNLQNVKDMSWMFNGCSSLTSLDVSAFNTANVTNMSCMFNGCSSLTSLDVSAFNTANVTNMGYMFSGCNSLTSVDLSAFNTEKVTDMNNMFNGCNSLKSVDLSAFNTTNVTNMGYMFSGCNSLTSVDLSAFNTKNVTNMSWMFNGCSSLTSLDVSAFNTENVTNMSGMFYNCKSLTSLDLSAFNTTNVTNMSYMFSGCNSLKSVDLSAFNTEKVTDMMSMFDGCSSLTSVDLSAFNTENVTNMSRMFWACNSLKSLDLSAFNTEKVTDMSSMFNGCKSLTSLDLSAFNTKNVTDMSGMFRDCNSLTSLDLSAFNTTNVTNMSYMFYNCNSLTSLNLTSFSATGENHPDLTEMFNGCSNLKTIYSHSFLWDAGCEGTDTFTGCTSLKGKVSFDPGRTDGGMATFEGYFTPAIKGDLDGDGKLSIADITRLVKRMSQNGNTYHYQADMNEDGNVTLDDLKLLEELVSSQE